MRPRAFIFRVKQCLVSPFIIPANRGRPLVFHTFTGPDSLVVRASASGSEGRGFAPRPRHTKGVKNGTGRSLADARNKRVVLGR